MTNDNDKFEYGLNIAKHRVYCNLVHIGRKYILSYLSKMGKGEITLAKPIGVKSIQGILYITKVQKCEDMNRKGSYFAKLYDNQGNDYILYQLGGMNLIKVVKTFKQMVKR